MNKKIITKRLFFLMMLSNIVTSHDVFSSGFQLWEQDGASVGNYHAGRAAIAEDASTAFYNPAGLVRIKNQQLVLATDIITTDFLFDGTIAVENILEDGPLLTIAQGGTFNVVPSGHYASPITPNLVFGLSVVAPFGLKTDYGNNTYARYAATLTSLKIIDFAPSLGIAINPKFSIGIGLDIEHADAQFDLVAGAFEPGLLDTNAINKGGSYAWGYHAGILYQFSPLTRVGLSYQSKVTHHPKNGSSKFEGELAFEPSLSHSNKLSTEFTLPATTSLSFFHSLEKSWDFMFSISYTQWQVFDNLVLKNVAGLDADQDPSNQITVVIPENYKNTWNYSVGANYHVNDQWFIRSGIGYDESPSNNADRNLQLPDSDRFVLALGTHYQVNKTVGFDVGWTHFFTKKTDILVTQAVGGQVTTTDGSVTGNADVFGFQMTWNFA